MSDEWKPLTAVEEAAMRPVPGGGLSSSWANRAFATLDVTRATLAARDAEIAKLREALAAVEGHMRAYYRYGNEERLARVFEVVSGAIASPPAPEPTT